MNEAELDIDLKELFFLSPKEVRLFRGLALALRERLKVEDPETMIVLVRAIYGLERLPYSTPGLDVALSTTYSDSQTISSTRFSLSESSLELQDGGAEIGPFGSDSFDRGSFQVETGGFRDGETEFVKDWIQSFVSELESPKTELETEDYEGKLDLSEPNPEIDWKAITAAIQAAEADDDEEDDEE